MSYDVSIGDYSANYTYNVAEMFYAANNNGGIKAINGMPGRSALHVLFFMIEYMAENRTAMLELNPENGWGDYDGAMMFLFKTAMACAAHPEKTVEVY